MAGYSLRHRRDGNAGTTILYHLHNRDRLHSSSVMTAGSRELLEDGHRRRIRRGRRTSRGTTGRTEQRADYAGVHRGKRTTRPRPSGAGRRVSPTTGTRSQTTCYVRRCTGRVRFAIRAKVLFYLTINGGAVSDWRNTIHLSFFLSNGIFFTNRRCGFEL